MDREVLWPIVDTKAATHLAKQRLHERRRDPEVKAGKTAVIEKHASRQFRGGKPKASSKPTQNESQMGFDF
jgi:deoxyribodipyrimidine photo-lyase